MIDHVALPVSDLERSRRFYEQALQHLNPQVALEWPGGVLYSFEKGGMLALREQQEQFTPIHVAFAGDRSQVDSFHQAATAAGGEDNGGPGVREDFHERYYAAFVRDPDGHNIETVSHTPV